MERNNLASQNSQRVVELKEEERIVDYAVRNPSTYLLKSVHNPLEREFCNICSPYKCFSSLEESLNSFFPLQIERLLQNERSLLTPMAVSF